MIAIGPLNSQNMISQVNFYVMDNVRRYFVMLMFGGQYSTEGLWFDGKAPLRISYLILF